MTGRTLPAQLSLTLVVASIVGGASVAAGEARVVRPPLFGLAVEEDGGAHRLVDHTPGGAGGAAMITGTLRACERRRLDLLTERYGRGHLNLPFRTLGGKQLWADEFVGCGWRVQTNVLTGHSRLLDQDDVRRAWGSYAQCRIEFERQRIARGLRPRSDHLVLLVHGLFRSKDSFRRMEAALESEGFEVEAVNYPSTRKTIEEHAEQLARILGALEGYRDVSFVTHSLGGIVVRELLARDGAWKRRVTVRRLVMLGPPNRGSVVAEMLEDWLPYKVLAGDAATQLTPGHLRRLPPPSCHFGVIAGGTGTVRGFNPALGGDNDGTILVRNARLDSADDFLLVSCLHSFLMRHDPAIEATAHFLKHGRFRRRESEDPPPEVQGGGRPVKTSSRSSHGSRNH